MDRKQDSAAKDLIFSALRLKAEQMLQRNSPDKAIHLNNELGVLLNELEIYELEIEMQNDELKVSHYALEMERLKFAGLFNSAPIGYLILDSNAQVKEINEIGVLMLQFSFGQIVGLNLAIFIHPEDRKGFYGFIRSVQMMQKRGQTELRLVSNGIKTIFARLDASVISHPITSENAFYLTITDITEAKQAQQKLVETTDQLNHTLEASHTGTWRTKSQDSLVYLDEFSKQILHLDNFSQGITIKQISLLMVEEDRPKLKEILNRFKGGEDLDLELRILTKTEGTKTVLVKGKAFEALNESGYFTGIIIDISERKKMMEVIEEEERSREMMLRRAGIEAQEKEREKISSALHDSVCQLLYGIGFKINHFHKDEATSTALIDIRSLLDQAIRELRAISNDLHPTILRDFGLAAGIKDMVRRMNHSGFQILSTIDQATDLLPTDIQLYIFRIIQELLNNSIKHSGSAQARVKVAADQKHITISVSDNGKGFSQEIEEALRLGSGLRGIKNRVSLLKGKLEIDGRNGAKFTICFPLVNYMEM
ncbi:PAS domain S-box-containing protein [Pedobacter sp. UYEF25]